MRLPEAVSRLAAPFFGSQAEPSSRQRGMFRANGSVCLAFGETHISVYIGVASLFVWPMHGVIVIPFGRDHFTLHSTLIRWGVASLLIV